MMTDNEYNQLHSLLLELRTIVNDHIEQEEKLRPRLEELFQIMERSHGVILFLKFLAYVGAPVGAFVIWMKDHVK